MIFKKHIYFGVLCFFTSFLKFHFSSLIWAGFGGWGNFTSSPVNPVFPAFIKLPTSNRTNNNSFHRARLHSERRSNHQVSVSLPLLKRLRQFFENNIRTNFQLNHDCLRPRNFPTLSQLVYLESVKTLSLLYGSYDSLFSFLYKILDYNEYVSSLNHLVTANLLRKNWTSLNLWKFFLLRATLPQIL